MIGASEPWIINLPNMKDLALAIFEDQSGKNTHKKCQCFDFTLLKDGATRFSCNISWMLLMFYIYELLSSSFIVHQLLLDHHSVMFFHAFVINTMMGPPFQFFFSFFEWLNTVFEADKKMTPTNI